MVTKGKMTLRESMTKDGERLMRERFEKALKSGTGFIIVHDGETMTDFYKGLCPDCISSMVRESVFDFQAKFGVLPKHETKESKIIN